MDKKFEVKKQFNPHFNPAMKEYVMELWMKGVSPHVINRLVHKKLGYNHRFNNSDRRSA